MDVPVTVNVQLMEPNGITLNSSALSLTGSTYTTKVFVGDFGRDKSGNYSCTADVRSSFLFHTNSISQATTAHVTVGKIINFYDILSYTLYMHMHAYI